MDPVDLQAELGYLLNRWDPIGIYDPATDYPPDEYDCMIAPLLTRLSDGGNAAQLSEYLWWELTDHFGLDPAARDTDGFANRLVAWYAHHSMSR